MRLVTVGLVVNACSDALEHTSSAGQVIGFANSNTLSLIAPVGLSVTATDLSGAFTSVSLAGGGPVILVLRSGSTLNNSRMEVVDLTHADAPPDGFSLAGNALGGVIQDDSIAWVAVFDQGAVARVNYRSQVTSTVSVGGTPRAVAITAGHVFVINSNDGGGPGAPSWVSKIDPAGASVVDSIPLTGIGATSAVVGGDSLLYVVETGPPGGRVSVVDPHAGLELVVINGLSQDVRSPVFHPSGRLLVAAGTEGILEVNTLNRSVTRGPGNGVKPGGHGVIALALDNGGRVYAGDAGCSVVHVLAGPPDYREIRPVIVTGCAAAAATAVRP